MSSGQAVYTQLQLDDISLRNDLTVFSPPGVLIEAEKYPILKAGVLATPQPSEYVSIYDHPDGWSGLTREAILSMRRNLYVFSLNINGRSMTPRSTIQTLQKIALSVSPVALSVEATTLPPRELTLHSGSLPTSPEVSAGSLEIISKPEFSRVAERVSEKDMPASEGILSLIDYDYSFEQITRLLSVGLLGRHEKRRILPTRNAARVVADTISNHVMEKFSDTPARNDYRIHIVRPLGELMVVVASSGSPKLDYFRIDRYDGQLKKSFHSPQVGNSQSSPKTESYYNSAKLAAMQYMWQQKTGMQVTVFHLSNNRRNQLLSNWISRAGVDMALSSEPTELSSSEEVQTVLDALLDPSLDTWVEDFHFAKNSSIPSILSYSE